MVKPSNKFENFKTACTWRLEIAIYFETSLLTCPLDIFCVKIAMSKLYNYIANDVMVYL